MESFRKRKNWLLLIACIFLNLVGRQLAAFFVMPFWLDAIGTTIAAIIIGPLGGAVCGALTSALAGICNIVNLAYGIVAIGIGVSVGYYFPRKKYGNNMFAVVSTAVFAGLVAVVLSTPLNYIFYDGRTGNVWGDGLIDMLAQDVKISVICSVLGEAFVDIPDKALSVLCALGIIQIYKKIFNRRVNKEERGTANLVWLVLPVISAVFAFGGMKAEAFDNLTDYSPTYYDADSGLETMEINAINQTPDGYIWVGTYAGLYRCDGAKFEQYVIDETVTSVMKLFIDSKGRLWIGTNDAGIACYDSEKDEYVIYNIESGLSSNAIRSINEDSDGNIYVGTATKLCIINTNGKVELFEDDSLNGVTSLTSNGDLIAGVSSLGELFFIKNKSLVCKDECETSSIDYTCVAGGDLDNFMVGTSNNYVLMATVENDEVVTGKKFTIDNSKYFNNLKGHQGAGGYFYCCENGCGFISNEGKVTNLTTDDFNDSIEDVIVDLQGNIWLASNKMGIVRYSWNPFQDIFAKAEVESEVANSVIIKDGLLWVGTNSGLNTIDTKTYYNVPVDYPELFENVRIRDIMEDSKGNVWICTYGIHGLIKLYANGSYTYFNEAKDGTAGGRFRSVLELTDGRIVAATETGINYIENDEVVITAGEEQGISTRILNMVETEDNAILAGTDGDGVYRIKDGVVTDHYVKDMDSQVILRIVPVDEDKQIVVSSNSLYYYDGNELRKLSNFPYKNNYDVFITDDGNAWVSSSAGIFVVNLEEMLADEPYNYTLLNRSRGLFSSITANSKSAFDGKYLYLCCSDGVRKVPLELVEFFEEDYDIRMSKVLVGDKAVKPQDDGRYIIPATSGRIEFDVAVLNFNLSNPLIHIYLQGIEDDGLTCQQKDIRSLSYMNLPYGNYKLHVQVLDVSGTNAVQEKIFSITKESQIFERLYFKAYLVFVCALFVLFLGWMIGNVRRNINNAEQWQTKAKIDTMTGFWNKAFSEQELSRICEESEGFLMMVDLDNFKLVNDLHGHDNGDKVLIRFAQLIKNCIREDDFAGRVGGDEFIVFIKGTTEESAVSDKARYLNEEIGKIGVEIVGEAFSIPLGVSIGAVAVPEEGRDFFELYRKADKALYNVKQNGKHGYDIFRNTHLGNVDTEEVQTNGLSGLRMILGERGGSKGAYLVDFDKLQMVYRLFIRMSKRTFVSIWIVQFMVQSKDGSEVPQEIVEKFVDVITLSLRGNDVVAPNGRNKAVIIMTNTSAQNGQTPIDRILGRWEETPGVDGYILTYETEDM